VFFKFFKSINDLKSLGFSVSDDVLAYGMAHPILPAAFRFGAAKAVEEQT